MMSMKALVYKIEQKLSSKAAGQEGVAYARKVSKQNSSLDGKLCRDDFTKGSKSTSKSRVDKKQPIEPDEMSDKVTASLRAKAALYDQIIGGNGDNHVQLKNTMATSGSGPFLVNFDQKRKTDDFNDSYSYSEDMQRKMSRHEDPIVTNNDSNDYGSNKSSSSSSSNVSHMCTAILNEKSMNFLSVFLELDLNFKTISILANAVLT